MTASWTPLLLVFPSPVYELVGQQLWPVDLCIPSAWLSVVNVCAAVLKVWSLDQQHQQHWELVRNADVWAPPQAYWTRKPGGEAQQCVLTSPPGESDAFLRTINPVKWMMVNKLWSQESEGEPFHLYTDLRKRKRPRHSDGCKNLESQACVLMIDSICVCVCVCIFNSFIWLLHMACGISVPWPGIEPVPPVSEVQSSPLVVAVHLLSHVWLFATPWTAACQAPLSSSVSQSLLNLLSVELVMPSNHLILCRPLLLLPSIFPSIRVFSTELILGIFTVLLTTRLLGKIPQLIIFVDTSGECVISSVLSHCTKNVKWLMAWLQLSFIW